MKKLMIKVNGVPYEVEVEEIRQDQANTAGGRSRSQAAAAAPAESGKNPVAPSSLSAAGILKAVGGAASDGSFKITAPMPGVILVVNVKTGDSVAKGQILLILEAMKMQNEIQATVPGRIVSVNVARGAAVNAGDVLVSIS